MSSTARPADDEGAFVIDRDRSRDFAQRMQRCSRVSAAPVVTAQPTREASSLERRPPTSTRRQSRPIQERLLIREGVRDQINRPAPLACDYARRMTSAQVLEICRRLESDYMQKFVDAGASGLDAWANNATIGVETRFGDRVGRFGQLPFVIAIGLVGLACSGHSLTCARWKRPRASSGGP
jgi:hypothetical protein